MDTTPHIIQGFFWHGDQMRAELRHFVGEIEVSDDGKFTGHTKDYFGRAVVTGEIKGGRLEFTKEYFPDSEEQFPKQKIAAKGPIHYILRGQNYGNAEEIVCGGWKGVYTILRDPLFVNNRTGQASCLVYPH